MNKERRTRLIEKLLMVRHAEYDDYLAGVDFGEVLGMSHGLDYDVMKRIHALALNAASYARRDQKAKRAARIAA